MSNPKTDSDFPPDTEGEETAKNSDQESLRQNDGSTNVMSKKRKKMKQDADDEDSEESDHEETKAKPAAFLESDSDDSTFHFEEEESDNSTDPVEEFPDFSQAFSDPIYQTDYKFDFEITPSFEDQSSVSSDVFETHIGKFNVSFNFLKGSLTPSISVNSIYTFSVSFVIDFSGEKHYLYNQQVSHKYRHFTFLKPVLTLPESGETPKKFSVIFEVSFLVPPILTRTFYGYVGLINDGTTCYLNSLLQSLFHLKGFRENCV